MIPEFKGKPFNELTNEQKIALLERVCMEHLEYLQNFAKGSKNYLFLQHWRDNALNLKAPAASASLDNYIYDEKQGFCIFDKYGELCSLKYMTEEIVIFVYNVVSDVPVKSQIIEEVRDGVSLSILHDVGVKPIGEMLGPSKALVKRRTGRPMNPNSKRQKVLEGKLTRYEAYQKKIESDDDAL